MKIPKMKKENMVPLVYILFGLYLIICLVVIEDNLFRLSVGVSTVFWLITSSEYMNNRRHMNE